MKRLSLILALVLSCALLLSACGNGTCPMERRNAQKWKSRKPAKPITRLLQKRQKK